MKPPTPSTSLAEVFMGGCRNAYHFTDDANFNIALVGLINCQHPHNFMVDTTRKLIYASATAQRCIVAELEKVSKVQWEE